MKKLILTLAIFCSSVIGINAQEGHEGHNHAKGEGHGKGAEMKDLSPADAAAVQTRNAIKQLSLTPEQGEKYSQLSLTRIENNRLIREKLKLTKVKTERQDLRKQVETNRADFDSNVAAMLTPEQMKIWEAKKAKMKENQAAKKTKKKAVKGKGKSKEIKEVEEEFED